MKKIDFGQTIGVLANLGVIAGIIFLGVELRQNNILMEAEARLSQYENARQFAVNLSVTPSLAEVLAKVSQGEELTEAEDIQVYGLGLSVLRAFQFNFREWRERPSGQIDIDAEGMRVLFHANRLDYNLAKTWQFARTQFDPDFVEFFEESVVNRPFE